MVEEKEENYKKDQEVERKKKFEVTLFWTK